MSSLIRCRTATRAGVPKITSALVAWCRDATPELDDSFASVAVATRHQLPGAAMSALGQKQSSNRFNSPTPAVHCPSSCRRRVRWLFRNGRPPALLGAPVVAGASLAACFRFNSARLFAFFLACDRREAIAWSFRREFSASIHQRSETRKAMRRRPISDGPSCLCIGRFNELQKRAIVRSNQRSSGVSGKLANNA